MTVWVKTSNSFGPQWFTIGRADDRIGKARREIERDWEASYVAAKLVRRFRKTLAKVVSR